ncbi:glutathione S-transferase [Klebsormidium nitens]|uniref:Glutathione S-transferase n=1 Tax=Klebsormidium nitens TaxID=105231 RepID=A0A1Y1IKJ1_KLENI|nr:glutathione S-transferase [Klebsormidium nitens]|eukprot:GAQ91203.1 glutathione S-transferase [Klebsormidium nitens]
MAFASSLCRIAVIPASLLRPCISATASRTFSIAPSQLLSLPSLESPLPQLGALIHRRSFLSGGARIGAIKSATWQHVTGQGASRSQTTMASADKPIQLYSLATPNGQKIGIFLEESGIPYEPHLIDIGKGDQFSPEFVKINPNSKIPAIVDPNGPNGEEVRVFESGAIMIYLAEKYNSPLYPKDDPAKKAETLGWLFWQVGGLGPMLGQVGHFFRFTKEDVPYAKERYLTEAKRLLTVLDKALEGKEYLVGDYSIADICCVTWVKGLSFYDKAVLDIDDYPNSKAWVERIFARPQVQKGVKVCAKQ